jgi:hypothetical protein
MRRSMEQHLLRCQYLYFGTSKARKLRTRVASVYCAGAQCTCFTGTKVQILTQLPQLLAEGTYRCDGAADWRVLRALEEYGVFPQDGRLVSYDINPDETALKKKVKRAKLTRGEIVAGILYTGAQFNCFTSTKVQILTPATRCLRASFPALQCNSAWVRHVWPRARCIAVLVN